MKRLKAWLAGYLIVCLIGGNAERFLALCAHRNILITRTTVKRQGIFLRMSLTDYRHIGPVARKAGTLPYIYRRKGFPFLLQWCRRHMGFCIGLGVFTGILLVLQQFVWLITVDGNYVRTDEQILDALRNRGIYVGCSVEDVVCEELEEYLRNTMTDIIWVSCEKDGTKLHIQVKEAYHYPEQSEEERSTGDIVAAESGVVTKLVVRRGVPMVQVGDTVNEGDILVSGTQILTDAYGTELSRSYLLAEADVEIRHTVIWDEIFSMTYETREYHEKKRKKYGIVAFGHEILKYKPSIPGGDCDIMTTYADLRLFSRLYLPIQVQVTTYETYDVVTKMYSEEEAEKVGRERYLRYLESLIQSGYELLEERLQMTVTEETTNLHAEITVQRPAWEYRDIVIEEVPKDSEGVP